MVALAPTTALRGITTIGFRRVAGFARPRTQHMQWYYKRIQNVPNRETRRLFELHLVSTKTAFTCTEQLRTSLGLTLLSPFSRQDGDSHGADPTIFRQTVNANANCFGIGFDLPDGGLRGQRLLQQQPLRARPQGKCLDCQGRTFVRGLVD